MDNTKRLIEICEEFTLNFNENVVVQEPYIPYIPKPWNRVLVLAESQNLSSSNGDYVDLLSNMSHKKRMLRLGASSDYIGVHPWDDGSLKLALEASLKINTSEVAVSNAVLWSQRGSKGENANPDLDLQKLSSEIWFKILNLINPKLVICSGKISQNVINNSKWSGEIIDLRLPSQNAMSRVSGMFNENDLLDRYPEVRYVIENNPSLLKNSHTRNKIFFACHAVSMIKKKEPKMTAKN